MEFSLCLIKQCFHISHCFQFVKHNAWVVKVIAERCRSLAGSAVAEILLHSFRSEQVWLCQQHGMSNA